MFPDYQSLAIQHYKKKLNENQLSSRLSYPTTAKFKAECIAKSANGFLRKDRKTLIDFFGENGDDKAILEGIAICDVGIFKPLWNYLKGNTNKTDPKNIELLAWLTDFEPRPYERGKKYIIDELETGDTVPEELQEVEQQAGKEEPIEENKKPETDVVEAPPKGPTIIIIEKKDEVEKETSSIAPPSFGVEQPTSQKAIIAILIIAVSAAVGFFMYTKNEKKKPGNVMGSTLTKEGGGCMYWAGDHYQQVPCNQKMEGILVIAMDSGMLNSFKKITRPDTITRNDINRVWYIKHNNKVEFYTASGNYPLDPTLRLKPITEHIISTYIPTFRQGISH